MEGRAHLRTRVLSGADWVEESMPEWQALVAEAPSATPFQTWEWQSTWWKHFHRSKKPHIFLAYEGNDLVGLMPCTISRGPWRALRAMGSGASDYLHPIARSGYEGAVAQAFAEHLKSFNEIDLIDLHQLRETQPVAHELPGTTTIEQARCLVLDLPPTYDAYLATLSKSLRYDVKRLDKTLFTEGKASVDQVGPDEIHNGMEILFDQHKKRWRKRGLPGAFVGRLQTFHEEWARLAIDRGWLWLSILRLEGRPIGAIYAMTLGERCYYYQAGFDPASGAISPGTLLVAATIRRAIEAGKRDFDFLRGDEPYKRRWKPQHEYKNLRVLMPMPGNRGALGARWNAAGSRVEAKVRARLEGGGSSVKR